jgi:hypothetical protein
MKFLYQYDAAKASTNQPLPMNDIDTQINTFDIDTSISDGGVEVLISQGCVWTTIYTNRLYIYLPRSLH